MAKIKTIRPIESISGTLKKSDKVGFAVRKATAKNFTVTRDDWTPHISPEKRGQVLAHQAKFKAVAQLARLRMMDAQHRQQDELAFKAQSKYSTLFGYLFHEEWLTYED